jgi:hypothetical protein
MARTGWEQIGGCALFSGLFWSGSPRSALKSRRPIIGADLFATLAHGGDEIILGSGMLPPPNCHDIAFGVSGIDVENMLIAWRLGIGAHVGHLQDSQCQSSNYQNMVFVFMTRPSGAAP